MSQKSVRNPQCLGFLCLIFKWLLFTAFRFKIITKYIYKKTIKKPEIQRTVENYQCTNLMMIPVYNFNDDANVQF
jgi:hypothetical protein